MNYSLFLLAGLIANTVCIFGEYLKSNYRSVTNGCIPPNNNVLETTAASLSLCCLHCHTDRRCRSAFYKLKNGTCILQDVCPSVCNGGGSSETDWILLCQLSVSCKPGWIQRYNSCYLFISEQKTWMNAQLTCSKYGSKLVEIETEEEDDYLREYIMDNYGGTGTNFWVGGTDAHNEGHWIWDSSKSPLSFTNWISGNPDNYGSHEHCLQIREAPDYKWNDAPCTNVYQFVCEERLGVL